MNDIKIAKWVGTTTRTLRNWKKPIILDNNSKYFPPFGKHNLYKSAKIGYYLLAYKEYKDEDSNEVSDCYNNLDYLKSNLEHLEELINMSCKENKYKKDIDDDLKVIKDIINSI